MANEEFKRGGTGKIVQITEDTITLDLDRYPEKMKIMKKTAAQMMTVLMGGDASEAASEAISEDMTTAMMLYLPLRGILSFTNGKVGHKDIARLIDEMNAAE